MRSRTRREREPSTKKEIQQECILSPLILNLYTTGDALNEKWRRRKKHRCFVVQGAICKRCQTKNDVEEIYHIEKKKLVCSVNDSLESKRIWFWLLQSLDSTSNRKRRNLKVLVCGVTEECENAELINRVVTSDAHSALVRNICIHCGTQPTSRTPRRCVNVIYRN